MDNEVFGTESIYHLRTIIEKLRPRNIFVVTGKKSFQLTGAQKKLSEILNDIKWYRYYEFEENPNYEDLLRGTNIINKFNPDLIIAIGGGSVIDTAKIISILPEDPVKAKEIIKGGCRHKQKICPMIAVPTTAGSGSEATHFAVAYIEKKKYSVASKSLLPEYVILDDELTYSMPPYLTAVTGMDALSQSIESYWSVGATELSQKYAKKALKIILESFPNVVKDPNASLRFKMLKAANFAGKAINISKTTAAHAISYPITMHYGIAHGHAVGILLPEIFKFNANSDNKDLNQNIDLIKHSKNIQELISIFRCKEKDDAYYLLKNIVEDSGLKTNLFDLGMNDNKEMKSIIDQINIERMSNNPVNLNRVNILNILKSLCDD